MENKNAEEMHLQIKPRVYGIANCGFYEGIQADLALKVLENWCVKTGCIWGSSIGVGGGVRQSKPTAAKRRI